jgi:putative Ca2+/H+ antiporter (TMEM165/GDT1 family)
MKKLIDYNQQEIEHRVKYYEYYQIGSYVLFVLFIAMAMWTLMTDRMYEKQCEINAIQDSCYINALYEQKLSIDTAKWYKEMGIKFETE